MTDRFHLEYLMTLIHLYREMIDRKELETAAFELGLAWETAHSENESAQYLIGGLNDFLREKGLFDEFYGIPEAENQ